MFAKEKEQLNRQHKLNTVYASGVSIIRSVLAIIKSPAFTFKSNHHEKLFRRSGWLWYSHTRPRKGEEWSNCCARALEHAEIVTKGSWSFEATQKWLFWRAAKSNQRNNQSTGSDYAHHNNLSPIRMSKETEHIADSSSPVQRERNRN